MGWPWPGGVREGIALPSAGVRRIIPGVLPCLLGAVAAHAVTGVLVHAGSLGGPEAAHAVHAPIGVVAAAAVVLLAVARRADGRHVDRWNGLLAKAVVTTSYLVLEGGAAEGYGVHLLHDPWILLAPVGVLVSHVAAGAMAAVVLAVVRRPVGTRVAFAAAVRVQVAGWLCDRRSVWGRPSAPGRGPPGLVLR